MSRTSLTDQLVDLRRARTGENPSQAVPAVRAALASLSADDRAALVAALRDGVPVSDRIADALLPAATTTAQRELEARVLQAVSDSAGYLHLRPPASITRSAHAVAAVQLDGPVVRLHPAPLAVGPLLYELLPRTEAGQLLGLPGLRSRQHPRSAELFLVHEPGASVVLAGVDATGWEAAQRYVRALLEHRGVPTERITGPALTAAERAHLAEHGAVAGPADAGSALLRRVHLFAAAPWLRVWGTDGQWWLDRPGDDDPAGTADRLLHPVFGLPGFGRSVDGPDVVSLSDGATTVHLRAVQAPDPVLDERMAALRWPREYTPWE
ncbi:hypothetical protein [Umezawaea beigongshangensis]|uniref:hypothetical protein n=1 Tax=Umezawaea beigongshangensis TaxID=2780383 RepID=UPI0018F1A550|nr:hypothetical protein [Umezawaea beigongshangensis]